MNRDEKSRLMIATRSFIVEVSAACTLYSELLGSLKEAEDSKLDNLSGWFDDGALTAKLEESSSELDEASDIVADAMSSIESLPDVLELNMRRSRTRPAVSSSKPHEAVPAPRQEVSERRTQRLQIVTTPTLEARLKAEAEASRLSVNELVNRLLTYGLEDRKPGVPVTMIVV